jgi:hypothetical protein
MHFILTCMQFVPLSFENLTIEMCVIRRLQLTFLLVRSLQANVLTEISCCFQKLRTETEDNSFLFSFLFSKVLSRLLYTIYPHSRAGEVSGELHQLVIAICDEVDV